MCSISGVQLSRRAANYCALVDREFKTASPCFYLLFRLGSTLLMATITVLSMTIIIMVRMLAMMTVRIIGRPSLGTEPTDAVGAASRRLLFTQT